MVTPDRRARMKANLQNRVRESYEKREDTGQFKSVFKEDVISKLWKCGEGEHLIDVIPYIAGGQDPDSHVKEGDDAYVLIIWIHYAVGVNQDAYVCPARNFNKPCPICEYREELRRSDNYDEALIKEMTPKRRSIYNIVCYDSEKEEAKGVQVFDSAWWFMEKHINALAKSPARGPGKSTETWISFADPVEGKSISFIRKGTKINTEFLGHKFVDRNYQISDEILDAALTLDECVNICTYDEIKSAFLGGSGGDVAPEEAPAPAPPPIQEGGLRTRRAAPAPSAAPPPAPAPRVRTTGPVAPASAMDAMICPVDGGTFGVDCEKFPECNGCAIWDPCSEEADKIAAGGAGEAPAPPVSRPAAPTTPRPQPRVTPPAAAPTAPRPAAGGTPPVGPRRGLAPRRG